MIPDQTKMYGAHLRLLEAASEMLLAYADAIHGKIPDHRAIYAVERLRAAGAYIGFDLVPRTTPKEAHEAAIAEARLTEDGPPPVAALAGCMHSRDAGGRVSIHSIGSDDI